METKDSKPLVRVYHSSTDVEDNKNGLASTSLRGSQDESKDIQLVRKWIDLGKRPSFSDVSQHGYVVKSLWNQFERLSIQDGLLVRRCIASLKLRDLSSHSTRL